VDTQSILLILKFVAEGVGVAKEIADIAKRVLAGEQITDAEIEQARLQVAESVANWDKAAGAKESDTAEQPE